MQIINGELRKRVPGQNIIKKICFGYNHYEATHL